MGMQPRLRNPGEPAGGLSAFDDADQQLSLNDLDETSGEPMVPPDVLWSLSRAPPSGLWLVSLRPAVPESRSVHDPDDKAVLQPLAAADDARLWSKGS